MAYDPEGQASWSPFYHSSFVQFKPVRQGWVRGPCQGEMSGHHGYFTLTGNPQEADEGGYWRFDYLRRFVPDPN